MPRSDDLQNEADSEEKRYNPMFQQMYPRGRDCDPRVYFFDRLSNLNDACEGLTPDEYQESRQEIFKEIVCPPKRAPLIYPLFLCFIFIGLAAISYGIYAKEFSLVVSFAFGILLAIWGICQNQKHSQWLKSFTPEQRTEIINFLIESNLIDELEQNRLLSQLDSQS